MNTLLELPLSHQSQSVLRPTIGLILVGFLIAGIGYCSVSVSLAQWLFPVQSNGSVLEQNGKMIGSRLVGQQFVSPQYFHARPSAVNYNVEAMAGSNLAVSNPELQQLIRERAKQFAQQNQVAEQDVPLEMLGASGSGIDPDISPKSALLQVNRIAQQRQLTVQEVQALVQQHIQTPQFGVYGQARVNVLELNLALDQLSSKTITE
ncbi:potassium-transporting ATPase subunit KdpC [Acinetobacter kanungonis]|uniref:potassium-transporting ATPase subunit KdpC n=1 Tax=Acinetobacter kanungonis TaxID=2699469 RepID=UPI00137B3AA0|nr:potassium-transporting ATPase subunit KdpC [Acinetobacter kanungonis]NCI78908.1 potassium-transporting ATPase subunit KdpC [Acinetobacter kanungonis]